jgi:hypothetical protein
MEEPVATVRRGLTPWTLGVGAITFLAGLLFRLLEEERAA